MIPARSNPCILSEISIGRYTQNTAQSLRLLCGVFLLFSSVTIHKTDCKDSIPKAPSTLLIRRLMEEIKPQEEPPPGFGGLPPRQWFPANPLYRRRCGCRCSNTGTFPAKGATCGRFLLPPRLDPDSWHLS